MNPETVHRTVLANGLTVLIQQDRTAPVVAIVTWVKAGYFDETDDQNGLAHALEHMFFKGTKLRTMGQIAKETKAIGGTRRIPLSQVRLIVAYISVIS